MSVGSTIPNISQQYPTLPSITQHYPTLPSITQHYPALPNITQHYPTLPSITQHYPTLPNITQHYPALPSITQHYSCFQAERLFLVSQFVVFSALRSKNNKIIKYSFGDAAPKNKTEMEEGTGGWRKLYEEQLHCCALQEILLG
jgi:hypothetical protein